jgi:hypothetical protein
MFTRHHVELAQVARHSIRVLTVRELLWVTKPSILEAYPVLAALHIQRRYTALEEPKRALQPPRKLVTGAPHQCRGKVATR